MITATQPDAAFFDREQVPLVVRNALYYAKLKEQLLTEEGLFRCDVLDEAFARGSSVRASEAHDVVARHGRTYWL